MTSPERAVTLRIGGMTCASCVRRVERALNRVEGVDEASVNFASSTARVSLGGAIAPDELMAAVERAGYDAAEFEAGAEAADEGAQARLVLLAVGGVLAVPVIIASMAMDIADLPLFGSERVTGWLLLGGAGVVQGLLGWRFYRASLPAAAGAHSEHGRTGGARNHGRVCVQRLGRARQPERGHVLRRERGGAALRQHGALLRRPGAGQLRRRHPRAPGPGRQVRERPARGPRGGRAARDGGGGGCVPRAAGRARRPRRGDPGREQRARRVAADG